LPQEKTTDGTTYFKTVCGKGRGKGSLIIFTTEKSRKKRRGEEKCPAGSLDTLEKRERGDPLSYASANIRFSKGGGREEGEFPSSGFQGGGRNKVFYPRTSPSFKEREEKKKRKREDTALYYGKLKDSGRKRERREKRGGTPASI